MAWFIAGFVTGMIATAVLLRAAAIVWLVMRARDYERGFGER